VVSGHQGPESAGDARPRAVVVVALCGVGAQGDAFRLDQKFHAGMLDYARRLRGPLACILPHMTSAEADRPAGTVTVPAAGLPYRVHEVSGVDGGAADQRVIDEVLDGAALACIGEATWLNSTVARGCRRRRIPYVVTTECTLRTTIDIMRAETPSPLRRLVRGVRLRWAGRARRELMAHAAELHANGFPTFQELAAVNQRRLLFFDTRATACDLLPEAAVRQRVAGLADRPPRLIFSGRYVPIKGALDVVRAGLELLRLGLDLRLDTYGEGPLRDEMRALVRRAGAGDLIRVHDAIPYRPDLIERTREADLFLACHVQGDPSCTYLETFACGVPVAGYANEMWGALQRHTGGGVTAPVGAPRRLAEVAAALLADRARLLEASLAARAFAAANTMEAAWQDRAAHLQALAWPG